MIEADPATSAGRHQLSIRHYLPKLMWNGRFSAFSGDPFNDSLGKLPQPEGSTRFPPHDGETQHLCRPRDNCRLLSWSKSQVLLALPVQ